MINILGRLLALLLGAAVLYLTSVLRDWAKENANSIENEHLRELVDTFVASAEQLFKTEEHSGEKKKEYVIAELIKLGYELNTYLDALIESSVYRLR